MREHIEIVHTPEYGTFLAALFPAFKVRHTPKTPPRDPRLPPEYARGLVVVIVVVVFSRTRTHA